MKSEEVKKEIQKCEEMIKYYKNRKEHKLWNDIQIKKLKNSISILKKN